MKERVFLRGVPVDIFPKEQVIATIEQWLQEPTCSHQIITLNATMLITALKNIQLKRIINQADLVTIDGYGVLLALRKNGYLNVQRFTGLELVIQILDWCCQRNRLVYFYGGTPAVVQLLKKELALRWRGIRAICRDGYGDAVVKARIDRELIETQPDLLFVGLGSPAQEIFLAQTLLKLRQTVGIGVGGALEVLAGSKKAAPLFLSQNGWEWCYRMWQNPGRLNRIPALIKYWYLFLR